MSEEIHEEENNEEENQENQEQEAGSGQNNIISVSGMYKE